jgi:hypothetical protein
MSEVPNPNLSRRGLLRGTVLGAIAAPLILESVAEAAVAAPTIASCATWGARPASSTLTQIGTDPVRIIVHHTATANVSDLSQAHAYALARSIQAYHMDNRGWADTGQHFTVSRGGYITEGRHTSLSHLNSGNGMVVGAHCTGQNDKAIGIETEGTYTSATPPTGQWNALVALCAYICDRYGIAPAQIAGHRDFLATACPGDAFYALLPRLRSDVAARLAAWSTVVDNSSAGFRASSAWLTASTLTQRYGTNYRTAAPVAASDPAYFSATLPAAGNYRVDAWYPASSSFHTATPYILFTSAGNTTVTVNQQTGGGAWRSLGTFPFGAGARDVAAVSRWVSGTASVVADAIRITRA